MMNKKGFTLIELLTVIALLAIIALIAVPNMLGISEDVKKEQMLNDAKKLISLAKMKINMDYDARNSSTPTTYSFSVLNANGDILNDPDEGKYDTSSYVKYTKGSINQYCVYLISSKRFLSTGTGDNPAATCVNETELSSKNIVKVKK